MFKHLKYSFISIVNGNVTQTLLRHVNNDWFRYFRSRLAVDINFKNRPYYDDFT